MQPTSSGFLAAFFVAVAVYYLVSRWLRAPSYRLRHIPTIGSSGIFFSYSDAYKFVRQGHKIVQEGYTQCYGGAFKVRTMSRWMVVVSGPQMLNDIRRATEDQLSFREAVAEFGQTDYMMGPQIRRAPYHIKVVRTPLTRNLAARFPDIKDEISNAFADLIPATQSEWTSVPVLKTVVKIVCRTSNRLFVGLPLCRNPDYMALNEQFTLDIAHGARVISMYPTALKPIVGKFLTKMPSNIERAISHTGPLMESRLQDKPHANDWADQPNDLISWLLKEAQGEQRTVHDLAIRLLSVNFGAIQTTSKALTHILFDLAAYPEYVEPMREEVLAVIEADGWTKASLGRMRKVDSFIKESQRLAIGALAVTRKVMQDFTFSNGITIPAGTHLAFATLATHMDEANYANPSDFRGFRFAEMRDEAGEGIKHQMVSLSPDYVAFGTGGHACPGRFFAVTELKAMLAHILLNYDVKLPQNGPRPENVWFQGNCLPNGAAEVMFRKRAT
ncbi:hypothetical protein GALMADRAFT_215851 [Galerina marginata CBS 339.88]|uniref:Cytochrome P450 n=1 Tax=Galerina marginata (strain CBS 339.88) TaxID=685588 RepID=A0A067SC11_GALM3|nr:hypothetical protein GALMADRAFT_215851 [Galerina marginata CBS 339.88]